MMILAAAVLAGALALVPSRAQTTRTQNTPGTAHRELSYRIAVETTGRRSALRIDLVFQGNSKGVEWIQLPREFAGQTELYNAVHDLTVENGTVEISSEAEASSRLIRYKPSSKVHVSYRIEEDWSGDLEEKEKYYRPIINPEFFHISGYCLFVVPGWDEDKPISVDLTWEMPQRWNFANSFEAGNRHQQLTTTIQKLRDSINVAGDFRLAKVDIRNRPVWIAMRGQLSFTDEEFHALVQKTVSAERDFWRDDNFPYFLITVLPVGTRCCENGGTGLTNSFAIFLAGADLHNPRLRSLLFHELFHAWNGRKIERTPPESLLYWFSEGFTNYYARLLSFRAGLMTFAEYVDDYNETIKK